MTLHLTIDLRAVIIGAILTIAVAVVAIPYAVSLADDGASPQSNAPNIALGTAFSFQGRLSNDGLPADGPYDVQARLFADSEGTEQVTGTTVVTVNDVAVVNGLFSIQLDFGPAAFSGQARFVEIRVRPGSETGSFVPLTPLQSLSPTPYSLAAPWTGIYGKPPVLENAQHRVTAGCAANSSIRTINADGSVVCESALAQEIEDRAQADNAAWSNICPSCDLRGMRRSSFDMQFAYFPGADLSPLPYGPNNGLSRRTELYSVDLWQADLSGADLSYARVHSSMLSFTNLSEANLSSSEFTQSYADSASLVDANMVGANLSSSHFKSSNISGLVLTNANLFEANLRFATGVPGDISGASWSNTICPDGAVVSSPDTCEGHWLP